MQQNARVPGRNDTRAAQIDVRQIRESYNQPTRFDEAPIQDFQGPHEATLEVQPALADEEITELLRIGQPSEYVE